MARPKLPPHLPQRLGSALIYLGLVCGLLVVCITLYRGGVHLAQLESKRVTLSELPSALMLSFLRMLFSYLASLVLSFALGLFASQTRLGEKIIIPLLDILQSVPVVGFFPAAISIFISALGGHRVGIEMAAVFLIFTSQAWNIAFAVYEATKTLPKEQLEAAKSLGLKGSLIFFRVLGPACIPRVVYNSILSWSNGWFFLVACEIITVGPMKYDLPGIGSFLARSAENSDLKLVSWGLISLTLLILLLDFLVWRPLTAWSERFKQDFGGSEEFPQYFSGVSLVERFPALELLEAPLIKIATAIIFPIKFFVKEVFLPLFWDLPYLVYKEIFRRLHSGFSTLPQERLSFWNFQFKKIQQITFWVITGTLSLLAIYRLGLWLFNPLPEIVYQIPGAILASTLRLIAALLISMSWTLPLTLWVWNRPRLRQNMTTLAQIGASLPAIALFPLIILLLVKKVGGGMELASVLLLMTGMQWYILFNVLGGVATIPSDLIQTAKSFGLKSLLLSRKLVIPAAAPSLVTGSLTGWGGGWNALVVAEYVMYKNEVMKVNGIGSLLNQSVFESGDGREIALCLVAMVAWILILNFTFWRPLYEWATNRFQLEG